MHSISAYSLSALDRPIWQLSVCSDSYAAHTARCRRCMYLNCCYLIVQSSKQLHSHSTFSQAVLRPTAMPGLQLLILTDWSHHVARTDITIWLVGWFSHSKRLDSTLGSYLPI